MSRPITSFFKKSTTSESESAGTKRPFSEIAEPVANESNKKQKVETKEEEVSFYFLIRMPTVLFRF